VYNFTRREPQYKVRDKSAAKASMHLNPDAPASIAAALKACAIEPESLNSERIEQRFGSYGIDIIDYQAGLRRSSLYSFDGERKICRTFAVVLFDEPKVPGVTAAHANILAGQSIGATLKSSGCEIRKSTLYVGTISLDNTDQLIHRVMQLNAPAELAMHAYRLKVQLGADSFDYATIVEIHHPDYLSTAELRNLYDKDVKREIGEADLKQLRSLALGVV